MLLNLLNSLLKKIKCSASLAFYPFSPTRLINSIKHEHSCKIFYFPFPGGDVPRSQEWCIRTAMQENLSSGFLKNRDSNQSPQLQRLPRKLKITLVANLDMILFIKRITKALIRLRGCAG